MDFELTDEQVMLRDTVRDLLARTYDPETRLRVTDTELGWSRDVWKQLADLGILGLPFAESDGGVGAGPVEAMVVLEEVGRRLAPEPIVDAVYVPGALVALAGSEEQRGRILPDVVGGAKLLAFAHAEPGVRWPATELATAATATAGSYTLTGTKNPVAHGDAADDLIVSATLPGGGIGLFLVSPNGTGVGRRSYRTVDGSRAAQIDLDNAPAELLGADSDASGAVAAALASAHALLCAEQIGAMEEALRLTTDYLKARKQFGVTLSKFQTLTQRAANMYVSLELARSSSLYATAALADGSVDPVVTSRARLQVGRAARHVGQEAIQMHGGIGVTAEYPVGHYVARLTAIERTLGGGLDHLAVLAAQVGDYELPEL
ncbi:acyl-CoA dehydrogenase family protein [Nocardia bovistercoris]|uniref:Acyl-CoA dehydrogenase family protein n=1 Tax=Nocardia bovistercoris TaxID=2785916 RepID=A0A931N1L2_9NOCA|nr:acyl-CoA dehydrogenase family protein [Nocardia bovistercoris]MBH0775822.1 acyl-CoA dehydrogenase family protein [Nocardia bovistercoris]